MCEKVAYGRALTWDDEPSSDPDEIGKNADMIHHVKMVCMDCGKDIDYAVLRSCPHCGLIDITCDCGLRYCFGE